jgi:hypothetical protein
MDNKEARKIRIEQLKKRIKPKVQFGSLFEECLTELGEGTRIYSKEESQRLINQVENNFKFTSWGRIDWSKISIKKKADRINEVIDFLGANQRRLQNSFLVCWDNAAYPIIETNLFKIMDSWDDVVAVGFDTWIVDLEQGIIIENYHEGEITVGIMN